MSKDTIYRQDAIDAADKIIARDTSGNNDVVKAMTAWKEFIKGLPSADPEKVLVAEVKLSKNQIQTAVDNAVEKMRTELGPCDFCKHKDDCGYMLAYCPAERKEE